jgi:hypothetical protein
MRGRVIECHESESNANTRRRLFKGLPRSFWRIAATCRQAPMRKITGHSTARLRVALYVG